MKKILVLLIVVVSMLIVCTGYLFYQKGKTESTIAYYDANALYDQFDLTMELEKGLEKEFVSKEMAIDSLKNQLDYLNQQYLNGDTSKTTIHNFKMIQDQYTFLQKKFQKDKDARMFECHEQIMLQLKKYTESYRLKHNYSILIGNNNGVLVSVSSEIEVTKQLVEYVNLKYQGL
jgi:Skp family chaperone for outer membrane proteins